MYPLRSLTVESECKWLASTQGPCVPWEGCTDICIERRAVSISRLPVWVVSSSFFFSRCTALLASSRRRLGTTSPPPDIPQAGGPWFKINPKCNTKY